MRTARARAAMGAGAAVVLTLFSCPFRVDAQAARNEHREAPEVRRLILRGVKRVDAQDLARSIATLASSCKSMLWEPFCLFTKSPTFYDKRFLDEDELKRD